MRIVTIVMTMVLGLTFLANSPSQLAWGQLQAESGKAHKANTPAPKFERDGTTIQKGFAARHDKFNERIKQGDVDLLFIGDSITQGWEKEGKEAWSKNYASRKAVNLGIGGDRTEHVLWRLKNGNIDGINPKVAVVMIGTNNSNGKDHTATEIGEGVIAIVKTLREKLPNTKVLVLAIFPRGNYQDEAKLDAIKAQREKNAQASALFAKLADDKMVYFLDIGPKFLDADGVTLSKEIMPDYLHLSPKGYDIWAEAIEPKLKELLGEK